MKEYGLFGGSFNPIHNGHLYLAKCVYEALELEQVILMPSGEAPHKDCSEYAPAEHRLEMCRRAAEKFEWMTVSDDEIRKNGKSYTVETLRALSKKYPDVHWTLMIGSDMLLSFDRWYCWEEILRTARICAVSREPGDLPKLYEKAQQLSLAENCAEIVVLSVRAFPVSSTQIRKNLQKNENSSCLLPKNVVQYIRLNGLYHKTTEDMQ